MTFVEYGNEIEAGFAMQTIQGFKFGDSNLEISYAKK